MMRGLLGLLLLFLGLYGVTHAPWPSWKLFCSAAMILAALKVWIMGMDDASNTDTSSASSDQSPARPAVPQKPVARTVNSKAQIRCVGCGQEGDYPMTDGTAYCPDCVRKMYHAQAGRNPIAQPSKHWHSITGDPSAQDLQQRLSDQTGKASPQQPSAPIINLGDPPAEETATRPRPLSRSHSFLGCFGMMFILGLLTVWIPWEPLQYVAAFLVLVGMVGGLFSLLGVMRASPQIHHSLNGCASVSLVIVGLLVMLVLAPIMAYDWYHTWQTQRQQAQEARQQEEARAARDTAYQKTMVPVLESLTQMQALLSAPATLQYDAFAQRQQDFRYQWLKAQDVLSAEDRDRASFQKVTTVLNQLQTVQNHWAQLRTAPDTTNWSLDRLVKTQIDMLGKQARLPDELATAVLSVADAREELRQGR